MENEPVYANYMSTREVSDLLGYTIQHTRFLIREGTLPGLKFGRDWLVDRSAIMHYLGEGYGEEQPRQDNPSITSESMPIVTQLQAVNVSQVPQRSPFRYPGGKTWLIPVVRQWLQQHSKPIPEFIEPFAGGGIVSLTAVFDKLVEHVTMIELDEDVASVWGTILNGKGRWLADEIARFLPTQQSLHELFGGHHNSSERHALATIVRNRVARGGILAPGAGIVKNGENGKGLTSRWYPETLHRRILDIVARKDLIGFIAGDGMQFMQDYAHRSDYTWFIDPPYTVAGKRLYRYSEIDHDQLFEIAGTLAGDFLMTYDNATEIRYLADKYRFQYRLIAMKTTHHTSKYELLIGKSLDWLPA